MTTNAVRVSDLVRRSAERDPGGIALEDSAGSTRLTYGDLWNAVERGASALARSGLRPGDRVLLALPSRPEWMVALLSIVHADLVAVPIPASTPPTLGRLAATFTGARAWIGDPERGELGSMLRDLRGLTPAELVDAPRARASTCSARPEAPAVFVFTSGSTCRPRAVSLSHENLRANLRALQAARQAGPNEAFLSSLPPSHAYELVAGQLAPLSVGARIVYASTLLPNRLIDALGSHRITRAVVVPALVDALARNVLHDLVAAGVVDGAFETKSPSELAAAVIRANRDSRQHVTDAVRSRIGPAFTTVIVGGAAAHPAWCEVLSAVGVALDVGYGLTEAGPVVAVGRANSCPAGSVGRPLPGVDVRIGNDGEILVSSAGVMQEYVADPAATVAAFEGSWLRTGDCGRLDDDGYLYVTGRVKDAMVTASGDTIYPDEIEPCYASPHFAELAVVPAPGLDGNDRPTLVVVPAGQHVDSTAIKRAVASLRAAAPPRLRVSGVVCRTEPLPRTAIGKVRRRALADALRHCEVVS
jgi:long-chain acyl-CoA synthetase